MTYIRSPIYSIILFMKRNLKRCRLKKYTFILAIIFNVNIIFAQVTGDFSLDFNWRGVEKYDFYGDTLERLSFDGAHYDEYIGSQLPMYERVIPLHSDEVNVEFEVDITDYELMPIEEQELINVELSSEPYFSDNKIISRDNASVRFLLQPFFKNEQGVMRVLSCHVSYVISDVEKRSSFTYAENSVLANGKWYKMSLSSTGVYKITYSELVSMGVPVTSLNPKNIRIYHNAGGALPIINSETLYDDLVELPIYVHGESDGVFNENDYILFYGRGPVVWENKEGIYKRIFNPYSDNSFAFLNVDLGEGKRIQDAAEISDPECEVVSSFLDYKFIDNDEINLNNMGATWYANDFDAATTVSYNFSFPNIITEEECCLVADLAARNMTSASFNIKANNKSIYTASMNAITNPNTYAVAKNTGKRRFSSNSSDIKIDITYNQSGTSSQCWLNYIELNAWRELKYTGTMMNFRNPRKVISTTNYKYQISNVSGELQVWDVSNPVEPQRCVLNQNAGIASFVTKGNDNNEFVAFKPNSCLSTHFVSTISNQDLHSNYDFDYLIITHPDFYSHAEDLKAIHNEIDDLEIEIVTPQMIYNEFSCGAMDITAIRNYIRMLYEKSGHRLRYVLLFGDTSYDYRNKSGKVCFVPTYESEASCDGRDCISTDDYFVCLDEHEGNMLDSSSVIDIAIGRIPVSNTADATAMVNKIRTYVTLNDESAGLWRKHLTFIADDDETHYFKDCEEMIEIIKSNGGEDIDIDKIYLDAYPQVASSSGQRAPECNEAITNRMERGTLLVNYVGHAGEIGWASERIFTNENILALRNSPKLHLMLTASCEFTRLDDHTRTSAGEYMFLNPNGGAIALISASRVTYGGPNYKIMDGFYRHLFDMEGGEYIAMGDMYVYAKQVPNINTKRYYFIGDPALRLCYPKNIIEVTSINNHDVNVIDTLRALDDVNVKGEVRDAFGNKMDDFNGTLHISFYDKESTYTTMGDECSQMEFKLSKNMIYSGKTSVVNGEFSVDFTLPKDINYSYGFGTISLYANSDVADAHGRLSNVIVGGYNTEAESDTEGPEIKIYIDDERFVDGSVTNENPTLIAYIKDQNGINTSGSGIGHDITVTLSGATNKTYNLNQFYDSPKSKDDYGTLKYKFYELNEGEHVLTFKAWDIYNNSSETSIRFNVVKAKTITIENVMNYPNPMDNYTNFVFDHNQIDNEINIQIKIYDVMGQLVKSIVEFRDGESLRNNPIKWDGKSDNGVNLSPGIYMYFVTVTNSQKEVSSAYSKLIVR